MLNKKSFLVVDFGATNLKLAEFELTEAGGLSLRQYGFKSLGVRKGYYQNNNEDALIMWTENIFWDKFKLRYQENIEKLKDYISIK